MGAQAVRHGARGRFTGATHGVCIRRRSGHVIHEGAHPRIGFRTNHHDTQAVPIEELKTPIALLQFQKKAPYAEITPKDLGVMQQNNPAVRKLGQPSFKIMLDRILGVHAVNMEQINGTVGALV
jgi:hypothetical protein